MQTELQIKDQSGNSYNRVLQAGYDAISIDNLEGEIWIDVIGYDGIYEVSNYGRIKSLERIIVMSNGGEKFVKTKIRKLGISKNWVSIDLWLDGVGKSHSVSNLVYMSFNKNSPLRPNEIIMHIDKNHLNNSLDNLKISTWKDSMVYNLKNGKQTLEKCLENLKKCNNRNKIFFANRVSKKCNTCLEVKDMSFFMKGMCKCKTCRNTEQREKRKFLKNLNGSLTSL